MRSGLPREKRTVSKIFSRLFPGISLRIDKSGLRPFHDRSNAFLQRALHSQLPLGTSLNFPLYSRCGLRNPCSMHRIFKYSRDCMNLRSAERMSGAVSGMADKGRKKMGVRALWMVAYAAVALPMAAQRQGPLPPPPPGTVAPTSAPAESGNSNGSRQVTSSHITNEPPGVSVQQIIQKFTEHEEEFRKERDNFTYTQIFVFQELDEDNRPDGEYQLTSDILFTPAENRPNQLLAAPTRQLKPNTHSHK